MIVPEMKAPPADAMTAVTSKYTEAFNLNAKICISAQMAQQNLYEVCKGLKEMRDGKLYKELGYQNFEDYTENEVGFGRMQAHRLIAIAENLPPNFVTSMLQIGTTKLALLAKLDEPQREELQQTTNLESASVRELKEKIKALEKDKAAAKERQDKLLKKNVELVEEMDDCKKDRDEAHAAVQSLEQQIHEFENRPHDCYEDTTKINELNQKLAEEEERHRTELEKLRNTAVVSEEDIEGIFRAYMTATVDSMKRLTSFIEQHANCRERTLFLAKLENIVILTNQTIDKLKGE